MTTPAIRVGMLLFPNLTQLDLLKNELWSLNLVLHMETRHLCLPRKLLWMFRLTIPPTILHPLDLAIVRAL